MILSHWWLLRLWLWLVVLWVMHLLQLLGQGLGGGRLWLLHWWLLHWRLGLQSLLLLLLLQLQLCHPLQLLLLLYLGAEQVALRHPIGLWALCQPCPRKPAWAVLTPGRGSTSHREH